MNVMEHPLGFVIVFIYRVDVCITSTLAYNSNIYL
jgi:hypothetical protein